MRYSVIADKIRHETKTLENVVSRLNALAGELEKIDRLHCLNWLRAMSCASMLRIPMF